MITTASLRVRVLCCALEVIIFQDMVCRYFIRLVVH